MFHVTNEPWEFLRKSIPGAEVSDFRFGVPVVFKSNSRIPSNRMIQGVASTPAKDLQREVVIQKGLDLRYFLQHGYFNNDHQNGFHNKVGQPTAAVIKHVSDSGGKKVMGLWVEGYLWSKGTHKVADSIWELAKAVQASGSDRKLGFSIEGKVLQRDDDKIVKAWVKDIAITPGPINVKTWMETVEDMGKSWACASTVEDVVKSIQQENFVGSPLLGEPDEEEEKKKAFSVSGGSPLVPESLEGTRKETFEKEKSIHKSLRFCYEEARKRGHGHDMAQRLALAATARTYLL